MVLVPALRLLENSYRQRLFCPLLQYMLRKLTKKSHVSKTVKVTDNMFNAMLGSICTQDNRGSMINSILNMMIPAKPMLVGTDVYFVMCSGRHS